MFAFLLTLLILDAIILSAVVLLQAGQGGGLASLGGATTDTVLGGRQAVTILTKMTWWCGGIFLALSLLLSIVPRGGGLERSPGAAPRRHAGGSGAQRSAPARRRTRHGCRTRGGEALRRRSRSRASEHSERQRGDRMTDRPAFVLLEDGAWFAGTAVRPIDPAFGEVVFTTNLTGYQETFTDPSYLGQIVVMTAPMIGNYGINDEDMESARPQVSGVVVREISRQPSNWRATLSLDDWLAASRVPVIEGVDTRRLTRHLRERGAMRGVIAEGSEPGAELTARLMASPSMDGLDLASRATVSERHSEGQGPHVVAYDFGMKRNIVRMLVQAGCRVTVVPAETSPAEVRELQPDGLFLSNGPGDPAAVSYAISNIRELAGERPPDVRHLPGTSADRPRVRRRNRQDGLRSPRGKSPGARPPDGAGAHHHPKPWVRSSWRCEAGSRRAGVRGYPPESQRRNHRGCAPPGASIVRRAVPSRGGAGPSRRLPALRRVSRLPSPARRLDCQALDRQHLSPYYRPGCPPEQCCL